MANEDFGGAEKAAILLLAFGEEISAEIFKHLNEFEIKRIGTAMSRLGRLEQGVVDDIMVEFNNIMKDNTQFIYGGSEYTKKVLGTAFKGSDSEELIDQISLSSSSLESLEMLDPKSLAGFIRNEHPQTIALILAHLESTKFADTLKFLPEAMHVEIVYRVANIESVAPELIEEIDEFIRKEANSLSSVSSDKLGGVRSVADILNVVDKSIETGLVDGLEERDAELAEDVRKLMFVFDDLARLDNKSIQELIKSVSNDKWKIALKSASDAVKDLVFKNLSKRAGEMLKEDMEALGPVKLSDVEAVHLEIIQVCKKLEAEGKVLISSEAGAFVS